MDPGDPARVALSSWKDIAAFFGRDVRTVQRWEKLEGLPVYRHKHHSQHSVYAYPEELSAWWQQRRADQTTESPPPETPPAIPRAATGAEPQAAIAGSPSRVWIYAAFVLAVVAAAGSGYTGYGRLQTPLKGNAVILATFEGSHPDGYFTAGPSGDLNGDGKTDVMFGSAAAAELYILLGGVNGRATPIREAADVTISTRLNAHLFAAQVADVDGDGFGDLLISTNFKEPDSFHGTAPAFIIRGRAIWPRSLTLPADADITLGVRLPKDIRLSACWASPFDLNGDGLSDLLLAASEHSPHDRLSAGGAFILFGRRAWPRAVDVLADADVTIHGSRTGEGLGPMCAIGDFDRDGRPDLSLLGSEGTLWGLLGGRGRVYLWYGRESWPKTIDAAADADLRIDGLATSTPGPSMLLADIDGNGAADLITGWPARTDGPERIGFWLGGSRRHGVFRADQADASIVVDGPPTWFGSSLSAADFDLDGISDLAIGLPRAGKLLLVLGRKSWRPTAGLAEVGAITLFGGEPGTLRNSARAGDLDGDSLAELIVVSEVTTTRHGREAGRAWVIRPYIELTIDVRPASVPNILYRPSGLLVVRVPGRGAVDAAHLDPDSLRLAGVRAQQAVLRDFDGDGVPDLQAYFDTSGMRVTSSTTSVVLTARTRDGRLAAGRDSVVVMDSQQAGTGSAR